MKIITRAEAKKLGLKRYFSGEPCSRGHIKERSVSCCRCVECSRLKAASPKERERRREYMAAAQRLFRRRYPEVVKANNAKQDKAKNAATRRAERAKNPEVHRAALRRAYQKHRAKRLAEMRAWREANKDAVANAKRVHKAQRRSREAAAEGVFSRADIKRLHETQNFLCAACPSDISEHFHVDHIVPLSRGGSNWPDNLQLLCAFCNISKGAKTMDEWAAWKAELRAYSEDRGSFSRDGAGAASS